MATSLEHYPSSPPDPETLDRQSPERDLKVLLKRHFRLLVTDTVEETCQEIEASYSPEAIRENAQSAFYLLTMTGGAIDRLEIKDILGGERYAESLMAALNNSELGEEIPGLFVGIVMRKPALYHLSPSQERQVVLAALKHRSAVRWFAKSIASEQKREQLQQKTWYEDAIIAASEYYRSVA